jgi:hypothetical protein
MLSIPLVYVCMSKEWETEKEGSRMSRGSGLTFLVDRMRDRAYRFRHLQSHQRGRSARERVLRGMLSNCGPREGGGDRAIYDIKRSRIRKPTSEDRVEDMDSDGE